MQLKKDNEEERLTMTNIFVTKNVFMATHTKYQVCKMYTFILEHFRLIYYQFP
jgi:hypothetical protein